MEGTRWLVAAILVWVVVCVQGQMFYWHPLEKSGFSKGYVEDKVQKSVMQPTVFKMWQMDKLKKAKSFADNDSVKRYVFRNLLNFK